MTERLQSEVLVEVSPTLAKLPKGFVGRFSGADTTPSVMDCLVWVCSSSVVTITNFDDGQEGQTIKLLGNANTTITHGSNIMTNTGANKALADDMVYTFTLIDNIWYEDE